MLLHALIPVSRANGPGLRAVVFFQGCTLGCAGCWNPGTHPFRGTEVTAGAVVHEVLRAHAECGLEGVTFSGGEPMQQPDSLLGLMQTLRRQAPELSFGMFSGYTDRELDAGLYWTWKGLSLPEKGRLWKEVCGLLDFAVLGRFTQNQPSSVPLCTSRNQVLRLLSGRYTAADFREELIEVRIHGDGRAEVTGFPVLGWHW
jgi:anaerobic ribonucleoside-triphosphate reductase activating protein